MTSGARRVEFAMHPISIKTNRVEIHPLTEMDAEDMFDYRSNEAVAKYQSFYPRTIEENNQFIIQYTQEFNIENTWFQCGVFLHNQLIGDIGIHFLGPDNSQCEIGYTISHKHQRMGYGKESVTAVIDYLFKALNKRRVFASLNPENMASIALLESIGFRREGLFKKSVFNHGMWEDDLIYAILEEEWE